MRRKRLPIQTIVKLIPLCIWYWPQWAWRDFKAAFREGYKQRHRS